MADIKWIKLYTNLPDNKKIKRIRKMPDGNNIILFWVFLLLRSGESNQQGGLFFTDNVPYDEDDLAADFDFSVEFVRFGLITLEKYKMIELYDDIIFIKNWEEYQSVDSMEKIREQTRLRVSRHREKQRLITTGNVCSYCGEPATGVDHIIASSRGGIDKDSNKTACCIRCNRIKNDKPLVDFLNSNRSIIKDNMIANNDKLNKLVTLRNVTNRYEVTLRNATELELELELELESNINDSSNKHSIESDFEKLWQLYPNKKGKAAALKSYKRSIKNGTTNKQIQDGIVAYKKHIAEKGIEQSFQKHGSTFFSGESWTDDYSSETSADTTGQSSSIPYLDEKGVYE